MTQQLNYWAYTLKKKKKKKDTIQKDTYTPIFTTALLTTARTWKHLNVHQQMNG